MKKSFLLLIGIVLSAFSPQALADTKAFQAVFDQRNAAVQAENLDGVLFGASASKIKRTKNDEFEPEDHYDSSRSTNLGGRIIRTEYKDTYTVITVRVLDEENLVYLPSKAVLLQKKITISNFEPGKAYSFDAYPHKMNKLKFWGNGGEPVSYFSN